MNEQTIYIILGVIVGLSILMAIAYFFYRFVFAIKRQLWNQKQTVKLLAIIAVKLGENPDQLINEIVRKTEVQDQFL